MGKTVVTVILIVIIVAIVAVMLWGMGVFGNVFGWGNTWFGGGNMPVFSCNGVTVGFNGTLPNANNAEKGTQVEKNISEVQGVTLDFLHENIEVVPTDGDTVRIEQTSNQTLTDEDIMRFGMLNGRLVAQSGRYGKFNIGITPVAPGSMITLYIPKDSSLPVELDTTSGRIAVQGGAFGFLEADSTSGEVNIESVTASNVELDTTSGRVTVATLKSRSLDVNTLSGSINVSAAEIEGMAEFDTTSGSVDFTGSAEEIVSDTLSGATRAEASGLRAINISSVSGSAGLVCGDTANLRDIDVDTTSGSVTIELPDNEGFTVEFDSLSGDKSIQFEMLDDTYKNGDIEINVSTVSGGLDILKK
ncbi:MAG TPA: hypothetical protein DEB31_02150 [Clostridiales bacterium]|nr:hypothetical protein [Clostridiales bacterium]